MFLITKMNLNYYGNVAKFDFVKKLMNHLEVVGKAFNFLRENQEKLPIVI